MSGWVAGAVVIGSVISAEMASEGAKDAANIQAGAAEASGSKSLEIAQMQIAGTDKALDKQIGAQKEALDKQIIANRDLLTKQLDSSSAALEVQLFADERNLKKTLEALKQASDSGNQAAQVTLSRQLGAQKEALDKTLAAQKEAFDKQVENLRSYKEAGEAGQTRLLELLGLGGDKKAPGFGSATTAFKVEGFDPKTLFNEFVNSEKVEADPGYAFRLSEGQKAIERSTAARGGLQSGAALKAAAEYGQAMGSQEYQNAFNRSQAATAAAFDRFQANKAFQAQEYGNAFNRFATERGNQLSALQSLQGIGQASAAGEAAAAGAMGAGTAQAQQAYGAGASTAYGNYGATTGNIAANLGSGTAGAYGNYGSSTANAMAGAGAARQSAYGAAGSQLFNAYGAAGSAASNAYGNYGSNLTNIYGQQGAGQINAITGAANARAAGQIGSANAFSQGISSAIGAGVGAYNTYNQNQLLQQYINKMSPMASDVAIKENIRQVGVLGNGLGVYEYEYKPAYKDAWGHGKHIGVMAQEVEQLIPEAVSVHPDGYKMVNYAMIH